MLETLKSLSGQQWVILTAFTTTLLPIAAGLVGFSRLTSPLRIVWWFCVCGFVLDAISRGFWLFNMWNLFLGHISTLLEFLLLANTYRIYFRGFVRDQTMIGFMASFTVLALVNSLFFQDFKHFNSYIKIIEAIVLIGFSLAFFYKLAREMTVFRLERYPMFWINCAVLMYFSSNLFVFLYSNYLLSYSQGLGIRIWFIHALFLILFNLLLAVGLWIVPKNSSSLP